MTGPNGVDDQVAMAKKYPLMNEYWEDKVPDYKKINIPVYACAAWQHFHFERFLLMHLEELNQEEQWMRAHREQEWPDLYDPKEHSGS